jgi:hypothetical protein
MEALFIILMLMLLSAVSNWLKRRGQPEEAELWPDETEPGDLAPGQRRSAAPGEPTARPARSSWEEELRRLLEGETPRRPEPKPAPAPTAVPPVVITASRPVSAPPPPVTVSTRPAVQQTIGQTALLLGRTRELQRQAASELRRARSEVGGRPLLSGDERRRDHSEEIRQARAWFRSPQAARQAVIASVILGPPRAIVATDNAPGMTPPGS